MTRPAARALLVDGVATLAERATLADAERLLRTMRRSALAVERRGRLVGVVLADDLRAARPSACTTLTFGEVNAALACTTLASIMRRGVPTVVPETPLTEVGRLLRAGVAAVPVLERERLVGLVEVGDLLRMLAGLETEPADAAPTSRDRHQPVTAPAPS